MSVKAGLALYSGHTVKQRYLTVYMCDQCKPKGKAVFYKVASRTHWSKLTKERQTVPDYWYTARFTGQSGSMTVLGIKWCHFLKPDPFGTCSSISQSQNNITLNSKDFIKPF